MTLQFKQCFCLGFTCLEGGFAVGIVNHGQRELGRVDAKVLVGYIDIRLVCEVDVDCSATALAVSASTPSFSADAPNDVADVKTCIGHGTSNDGGKGGREFPASESNSAPVPLTKRSVRLLYEPRSIGSWNADLNQSTKAMPSVRVTIIEPGA